MQGTVQGNQTWMQEMPLQKRLNVYGLMSLGLVLGVIMMVTIAFVYVIRDTDSFLGEMYLQGNALSGLNELNNAVSVYIEYPNEETRTAILRNMESVQHQLAELEEWGSTGLDAEQSMLVKAALQTSETYKEGIQSLLAQPEQHGSGRQFYVDYYAVMEAGSYVDTYLKQLIQVTLLGSRMDYAQMMQRLRWLPAFFLLILALAFGLVFWLKKTVSSQIIQPVLAVAGAARTLVSRNMDIPDLEVCCGAEIGGLVRDFNRMKQDCRSLIQIKEEKNRLMESLYEEKLIRMDAEKQLSAARFSVLKNQINPHFLFNALSLISQTASMEEAGQTQELVLHFSDILRYNLYNQQDFVPVRQELEVLDSYMCIQESRFGDRLLFWIECGMDPDELQMPSFTLQPLVENAVSHGISPQLEGGKVRVKLTRKGERIHITITDTGKGIEPSTLEQLCNGTYVGKNSNSGIGVGNVRSRLLLLCPDTVFRIWSKEGLGTCVRIELPVIPYSGKKRGDEM